MPDHTIRESARAKHVRFKVSVSEGLVVVIPKGFDRGRIPKLLEERRDWIERAMEEIEAHRGTLATTDSRPDAIQLPAIGEVWQLEWNATDASRIRTAAIDASRLRLSGPIGDRGAWRAALRRWLLARGREVLIPWAEVLAEELGVRVERVTIRCQKSRWGSYSARPGRAGTLSLNAQLLFLPEELVRFVLLHELCHARHPNHSTAFWDLVRSREPETDRLRLHLRTAWKFAPAWLSHLPEPNGLAR